MPKRIQMTRQMPWRADNPNAVIVARPSKWGNPFRVSRVDCEESEDASGKCWQVKRVDRAAFGHWPTATEARRDAVEEYRIYVENSMTPEAIAISGAIAELTGHDLACWCPLDQPCHADVLIGFANPAAALPGTDKEN